MLWLAYLVYISEPKHVFTDIRHLYHGTLDFVLLTGAVNSNAFWRFGMLGQRVKITVGIGNVRT